MNPYSSWQWRRVLELFVMAMGFVFVSYEVRIHEEIIRVLLSGTHAFGPVVFVLFTALFVVFVIPLDIVFLIPIGVLLWGPVATGFLSIVGWTIGASVAFSIARRYGLPLVIRLVGERRASDFRDRVPRTNLFASVILLRMLVPVDLLSYALGLFTDMSWRSYVVATALGVAPFGFYFAYAGTLPLWYQFLAVAIALVFATVIALRYFRRAK